MLDGHVYTYNPVGEFWLLQTPDFEVQARMVQSADDTGRLIQATQFQAVAMRSNATDAASDRIHLQLNSNRTGN